MRSGLIGAMLNPRERKTVRTLDGITFALDNGCFSDSWIETQWLAMLDRMQPLQHACLFAVAPDVVADFDATLTRARPWLGKLRAMGYRPAFVAQDGLDLTRVPWDDFDAWFTGGSTEWKMSQAAWDGMHAAKARGKWCHLGRVNGGRKLAVAAAGGYDSADGTFLKFAPDTNLQRVRRWLDAIEGAPTLDLEHS